MRGITKGSCPKCHNRSRVDGGTVRPSGTTHYICDETLTDSETGRHGCNAQFYIQGVQPYTQFDDRYIHFPFNVIFQIQEEGMDSQPGARAKGEFFRKPCIWTVYPNRITQGDIDKDTVLQEEQDRCRRECPDRCERVHCPKNPAKIYCVDPKTMKPSDPPCTSFPNCDCIRIVPEDMWQCVWHVDRRCPDEFAMGSS